MRASSHHDPIEARLDALQVQWINFTRTVDARVLVWRARPEERAMIDAFVAHGGTANMSAKPNCFVHLTSSFRTAESYGTALAREIVDHYRLARDASDRRAAFTDDVEILLMALSALHARPNGDAGHATLAVWLDPDEVRRPAALGAWLSELARVAPRDVRFFIVDDALAPAYAPAEARASRGVCFTTCALDMGAALAELAQRAGGDGPGAEFRRLQTRLVVLLSERAVDDVAVGEVVDRAVSVAHAQGWPHLAAAVRMAMASGLAGRARHGAALRAYDEAARDAALAGAVGGEASVGARLRLGARLGRAAVLLAAGAHDRAAAEYAEVAALGAAIPDARAELDGHRLASFCHAAAGDTARAWARGMHGLKRGLLLDEAARAASGFSLLVDHLFRLTRTLSGHASQRAALEARLREAGAAPTG